AEDRIPPRRHRTNLRQRIRRRQRAPQERYQTRRRVHNDQALEQRPRIRDSEQSLRPQPQTARPEISRPLPNPLASPRDQERELGRSIQIVEGWEMPFYRRQQLHNTAP